MVKQVAQSVIFALAIGILLSACEPTQPSFADTVPIRPSTGDAAVYEDNILVVNQVRDLLVIADDSMCYLRGSFSFDYHYLQDSEATLMLGNGEFAIYDAKISSEYISLNNCTLPQQSQTGDSVYLILRSRFVQMANMQQDGFRATIKHESSPFSHPGWDTSTAWTPPVNSAHQMGLVLTNEYEVNSSPRSLQSTLEVMDTLRQPGFDVQLSIWYCFWLGVEAQDSLIASQNHCTLGTPYSDYSTRPADTFSGINRLYWNDRILDSIPASDTITVRYAIYTELTGLYVAPPWTFLR